MVRQSQQYWQRTVLMALTLSALVVGGCWPVQPDKNTGAITQPAAEQKWSLTTARRQRNFITPSGLPAGPGRIEIHQALSEKSTALPLKQLTLWTLHKQIGTLTSPAAEQFTGESTTTIDNGSFLVPIVTTLEGEGKMTAQVDDASALLLEISIPATFSAGTYQIPVHVTQSGPSGTATNEVTRTLEVTISDITLPTQPAIHAIATTNTDELAAIFPATFGQIQANYLDRNQTEHKAAVDQLDALVKRAWDQGVALYVEDLSPTLKVDSIGRVTLDWDAYDRTMFGYMDGSAFSANSKEIGGLAVWLAPLPPRRIRETSAQLRQYWQACLAHHQEKGWKSLPVLMHPALLTNSGASPELIRQIREICAKDIGNSAALVDMAENNSPSQQRVWLINDSERRLPPVGELATEQSVRVWPWLCQARGLKGFVWRHAVGKEGQTPALGNASTLPLLVEKQGSIENSDPRISLRLAWLREGLNDAGHFDLLTKRSDPAVAGDVLAGVVGRTGLATPDVANGDLPFRSGTTTGYLYAGWPHDMRTWQTLPAMVDKLIEANAPGAKVELPPDDPLLLKTKMWLAQAHRPVARVRGYQFSLTPSREGSLLGMHVQMVVENPVHVPAGMAINWRDLPGDLQVQKGLDLKVPGYGLVDHAIKTAGHLSLLTEPGRMVDLELTERVGGAVLNLPVMVPVYRMRALDTAAGQHLRIDARGEDWPEGLSGYAPMLINQRYASRPYVLNGLSRIVANPASVKWSYDSDWIYALVRCPQKKVSDERTSQWPVSSDEGEERWWGSDGVQLQIAGGAKLEAGTKIYRLGIKPSGTVLVKSAIIMPGQEVVWTDGGTVMNGVSLKYAVRNEGGDNGYTVELAIPRKWFAIDHDQEPNVPLWRVNVLRHQEDGALSTSWNGPLLDDAQIGMMGLLVGGR